MGTECRSASAHYRLMTSNEPGGVWRGHGARAHRDPGRSIRVTPSAPGVLRTGDFAAEQVRSSAADCTVARGSSRSSRYQQTRPEDGGCCRCTAPHRGCLEPAAVMSGLPGPAGGGGGQLCPNRCLRGAGRRVPARGGGRRRHGSGAVKRHTLSDGGRPAAATSAEPPSRAEPPLAAGPALERRSTLQNFEQL